MKKILFALALLLTIIPAGALAQSNPPLSNKRIRMKGQAAAPTPDPPTGYYNLWVDSGSGNLYITNAAGTDTPVGAGISGLTDNVIPQANGTTAIENSKMTASGGSSGTWTLYDSGGTGVTSFVLQAGANQSTTDYLQFVDSAGANSAGLRRTADNHLTITDGAGGLGRLRTEMIVLDATSTVGFLGTAGVINVYSGVAGQTRFSFTNAEFNLAADAVLRFSATSADPGASKDLGAARDGVGILRVTDGSTGQGGIGIADSATNTVSDALILRHATSGTAAASFGTGLLFQGEDAAGNMQDMASIDAVYTDASDGSEDVDFKFYAELAGTLTHFVTITPNKNGSADPAFLFPANGYITASAGTLHTQATTAITFEDEGVGGMWTMLASDNYPFYPSADNTQDIGTSSAKVKNAYLGTSIQGTRTQAITDNAAAATFVTIAVPTSNTTVGGRIFYTITAIDAGTAIQTKTGTYSFGLNNIGGTVTGAGTDVLEHSQLSVGTLAPTFSVNISGTNAQFQLVLDTSLDAGAETLKIEYRVQIDSGTATVTPAT